MINDKCQNDIEIEIYIEKIEITCGCQVYLAEKVLFAYPS
jgi:hypothetical protein